MKIYVKMPVLIATLLLSFFHSRAQYAYPWPNLDFEYAAGYGWWDFSTGSCCPINTPTPFLSIGRHTIMTGGFDPNGWFPIVPSPNPECGNQVLRLGNSGTGSEGDRASYTLTVPSSASNYTLVYRYAVVLQDGGHDPDDQARFEVKATDVTTGTPIICAQTSYVVGSSMPGFTQVGTSDIYYLTWRTGLINLNGLSGHNIKVDFATGDCAGGGHFGYAYVDLSGGPFETTVDECAGTAKTLHAPFGFQSYTWYNAGFTSMLGTSQDLAITVPTTTTVYAVVIDPFPGFGCNDTLYVKVIPHPMPVAGTISGPNPVCGGSTHTYSNFGGTPGGVWTSSVGAMNPSTGEVTFPNVAFPIGLVITRTVSGPFCPSASASMEVTLNPSPIVSITAFPSPACPGQPLTLTSSVPGIFSCTYDWHVGFPPTTIGTSPSVTVIAPSSAASYGLTVTNSFGCSTDAGIHVPLYLPPTAGTISVPHSICAGGGPYILTAPGSSGGLGIWSIPPPGSPDVSIDPISGELWINPALTVPISVMVEYKVTNPCGATDVATSGITVYPTPSITITGPTDICEGSNYTLNIVYAPPYNPLLCGDTYLWNTGATTSSITYTSAVVGGYTAYHDVTVENAGHCSDFAYFSVNVHPKPEPTIDCPQRICVSEPIEIIADPGPGFSGGVWTTSGAITVLSSTSSSITIVGASVGTAILTYTVTDPVTGCSGSAYCYLSIFPSPEPISGPTTVCEGSTITLFDPSPGGAWESNDPLVATVDASGVVTGVSGGTTTISYVFPGGCAATYTVTVTGRVTVCVEWGLSPACSCWAFIFTGTPGATVHYESYSWVSGLWTPGSFTFSGSTYEIPYSLLPGNTVMLCVKTIEYDGCEWECKCPAGECCAHANLGGKPAHSQSELGTISQNSAITALSITPNPNTGTFKLSGHLQQLTSQKEVTIEIVDMLGKTLMTVTVPVKNGGIEENIAMREVANGVYMIKVKGDNVNQVIRFVVDK